MDPRRATGLAVAAAVALLSSFPLLLASSGGAQASREAVATDLAWPVSFVFPPPGPFPAGSILYSERFTGNVRLLPPGGAPPGSIVANTTVFADGEEGFLGIAVASDFASRPYVYAYHTYLNTTTSGPMNRVIRWWLGPTAPPGPPPKEVVLDGIPANTLHDGGILAFADDGTLFITTGDASMPGNAQDNASLSGKVLRVRADGSIPADNPIPGSPVYTLGHRNVFGLAFQPATGVPFISENGPTENDEVNVLEPGRNYGWPIGTGALGDPRFADPILTYRSVIAPTGIAFYTGNGSPRWTGSLFLGDWNFGNLHRLTLVGPGYRGVVGDEVVDSVGFAGIIDVEDGPDGDLYFSTPSAIYRVRDSGDARGHGVDPLVALAVAAVAILVAFVLVTWLRGRRRRRPPPLPPAGGPPP